MATLIEEELARRDAAAAAATPREIPSTRYMRPQERLQMESIEARRERDASLAAQREAMMAQRADIAAGRLAQSERNAEHRAGMDAARFDLAAQNAVIDQKKADLAAMEIARKNDQTLQILDQATNFLRDARGMDPTKPEFDTQFQDLVAGYPLAAQHPSVEKWIGYHQPLRQKFVTEEIALRKPKTEGTTIKNPYGTEQIAVRDADGNVVAKETRPLPAPGSREDLLRQHAQLEAQLTQNAGKKDPDATVVQRINDVKSKLGFALIDPKTGAAEVKETVVTQPSGASTVKTTEVIPAPNPNQAAIDWVNANPDDPRAAAIKEKLGIK